MYQVGERIKEFIEKKSITQEEVMKKTGLSRQTLWRYIKNETSPDVNFLATVVKDYGLCAYWLLTGEGEMIWKGKKDKEVEIILKMILGNPHAKKALYHFWNGKKGKTPESWNLKIAPAVVLGAAFIYLLTYFMGLVL